MESSVEALEPVTAAVGLAPLPRRKLVLSLASLMMALALAALDNNIVNTALPRMAGSLGGLDHLSWVVTAFMLASTVSMPLYGKLSDIYGRRPLFTTAIAIFLAGSLLCSVAQTMTQLIVFRLIQGIGAGGLLPLVMTAVGDILPPRERGKYQGLFSAVFTVSNLGGPVLGGLLTDSLGWRSIFYINIPLGLLALVLLRANLPPSIRRNHAIDYAGVVLVLLTTVPFLLALSSVGSAGSGAGGALAGLAFAAVAGCLLYWRERNCAEPVIAVNLFPNPAYGRSVLATALIGLGFFGAIVFLPLYLQQAKGLNPAQSGLMVAPQILGNLAASVIGGQIVARTGRNKPLLVIGMIGVAGGLLILSALLWTDAPLLVIGSATAVIGVGGGLSMPQLTISAQNAVERRDLGAATSTLQFFNSLAASSGVALSGAILNLGLSASLTASLGKTQAADILMHGVDSAAYATHAAIVQAYDAGVGRAFLVCGFICIAAFIASLFVPSQELAKH